MSNNSDTLTTLAALAVSGAELEAGRDPASVQATTTAPIALTGTAAGKERRERPARWSQAEDLFLRENLGRMSEDEIGAALGRTKNAVRIRWTRELRLPAPSKDPRIVTARGAARMLGVDEHKIAHYCDVGLIEHRIMAGGRNIRLIDRKAFVRWAVNPMNWIYFDPDGARDPHLRRLLRLAQERWDDEWWTTRRTADYHGVTPKDVLRYIYRGDLEATRAEASLGGRSQDRRWSNWFVLRSAATAPGFRFRGQRERPNTFTAAADAWILQARDERGMTWNAIERTMKRQRAWTIRNRYHELKGEN